jgi:REP element-mobilizing transposase RayT
MARPIRIEYEGAVYHVTLRGNERRPIFKTDGDRERFIQTLSDSVERYEIRLYLYCLMSNHVHMVLETPRGNLSRFMHRLQTAYTVYFNRRHRRSGHLMQGRFGASLVDENRYILKLSRYVHLNPVYIRSNRGKSPSERVALLRSYVWSSYRGYIGQSKREDFVDYGPVLAMMEGAKRTVKSQYRRFVEAGISEIDSAVIVAKKRSPLCIGSDDSVERIECLYHELVQSRLGREDISFRQMSFSMDTELILSAVCRVFNVERSSLYHRSRNSFLRAMTAKFLCELGGLTQREVGVLLKIGNGASVSKQLKKLAGVLKTDLSLQKTQAEIKTALKTKERADP